MKIQVSFKYKNVPYRYTIDEVDVDPTHYDNMWDYWVGENENELAPKGYVDKSDEDEMVFEVCGFKSQKSGIISGENMVVSVYKNVHDDEYINFLDDTELDVRYA